MSVLVHHLRAEHRHPALGIGTATPRISWQIDAEPRWSQRGYQIELTRHPATAGDAPTAPTVFEGQGNDQLLVPWPDEPLASREQATIRVRVEGADVEDQQEQLSPWSEPLTITVGLLEPQDWQAVPVGIPWWEDAESDERRPALLRRDFDVDGEVASAILYASAHGLYQLELNGRRIGDEELAPGWTSYPRRLRYSTHDVTELITAGSNAIGSWLGDGWYRGRLGWRGGFRNLFGHDQALIAQLEIRYTDGRTVIISSDHRWRAAPSPIEHSGIYDGETYDARAEQHGWSEPGFDDSDWSWVKVGQRDPRTLVAPDGPPVRCTQELQPIAVLDTPSGKQVVDFGQNFAGRVRLSVNGPAGTEITLRTAEVMQQGEIYTRPLRDARSTDRYILAGRDREEWEPRFTIHGFRYVEVTGWPGDLRQAVADGRLVGRVLHSDLEPTGSFSSSDAKLNKLHENVRWSMRSNFVDLPTDCPQRDERVGWTGDIQVFAPTASFLYDCSGFLRSWLRDLAVEQLPDGTVPWYLPVIPAHAMWTPIRPGAAWGDVAVLTPWVLYERFGDRQLLHDQYPSAKAWVDLVDRLAGPGHLWDTGFQLGDWLDPDAPPQDPADAKTDRYLVATAYFARSTATLARMAEVLDNTEDAIRYRELAARIRDAFRHRYVTTDGDGGLRMTSDAQTAYALAISFDLLPDEASRLAAGRRLAELVAEAKNRISTGFVGTPLITEALSSTGQLDRAYDLLLETACPSWLYAVEQGATTIWERWDSQLPDGTVNPGTMTSFNHYALGAVADWLHRVVAGLDPVEPGYRRIAFRPRPGGGLTSAQAELATPYGPAAIGWRLDDHRLVIDTRVPTGATAFLDLPDRDPVEVSTGSNTFTFPRE
ncbi:alpha-L-rhamnosidase [Microlunatus soli]|uniref:alpha-L-rhamnosidase n=1 Tax=Microlunatus soli TaxID=630515 RepID=A0A1H1ZRS7_9ACTN|nr:alpha-L-rhamnosidase [Microlunatus soli]SDT36287.1 alpha-L-rhamnosidase [Microlunatus soli]